MLESGRRRARLPDRAALDIAPGGVRVESKPAGREWRARQQQAGAHHQLLDSGKVPPIHERLLDPGQAAHGLAMADSMDNLAALIPR